MPKKFYITTPIYYVNDVPHIGRSRPLLPTMARTTGFEVWYSSHRHGRTRPEGGKAVERALPKERGPAVDELQEALVKARDHA
jgi:hypothetical protein